MKVPYVFLFPPDYQYPLLLTAQCMLLNVGTNTEIAMPSSELNVLAGKIPILDAWSSYIIGSAKIIKKKLDKPFQQSTIYVKSQ